jgi:predicted ATP-binding protein involved in virulence
MHPRWQQVLVPRLKKAFPNVQFIACTHSPLIVGGMQKEEVERFALANGQIQKIDFDPDMTLGRTDQILTGELFGLPTTLDPATQVMMVQYEELLGKSERTAEEEARLTMLGKALETRIPPSDPTVLARRASEMLESLRSANLGAMDVESRNELQERMARLSKTLRMEREEAG